MIHFQGRILGITIGCLIGMTPLLFIDTDKDKKKEKEKLGGEEAGQGKGTTVPGKLVAIEK